MIRFIQVLILSILISTPAYAQGSNKGNCIVEPSSAADDSDWVWQGRNGQCSMVSDLNGLIGINRRRKKRGLPTFENPDYSNIGQLQECLKRKDPDLVAPSGGIHPKTHAGMIKAFCECNGELTGLDFECSLIMNIGEDGHETLTMNNDWYELIVETAFKPDSEKECLLIGFLFNEHYGHAFGINGIGKYTNPNGKDHFIFGVQEPNQPDQPFSTSVSDGGNQLNSSNYADWVRRVTRSNKKEKIYFAGFLIKCLSDKHIDTIGLGD